MSKIQILQEIGFGTITNIWEKFSVNFFRTYIKKWSVKLNQRCLTETEYDSAQNH